MLNKEYSIKNSSLKQVLDNEPVLQDKPDEYFEDIKEFRRSNKDFCIGPGHMK